MTEVAELTEFHTGRKAMGNGPKADGPQLRYPTFNCLAQNKYEKLKNFKMEVGDIFMTKRKYRKYRKKVLTINNWLGKEGL